MHIYFDNSATTKPWPEVAERAAWAITERYGNPSSSHLPGKQSRAELARSRQYVADLLGCQKNEIYFTSGGTESNNLAIFGGSSAMRKYGGKIVTTAVEHASVTKALRILRLQDWQVVYIPSPKGVLDLEEFEKAVDKDTVFVSVMLVNNEIGCIFPVEEVSRIIKRKGSPALLHCDAVQAFGKIPFTPEGIGADLVSVSAHKIHGIKGAGALFARSGLKMHALQFGGGQERGLRPGTEGLPQLAAFGEAAKLTRERMASDAPKMAALRDYCHKALLEKIPEAEIFSTDKGAPHIVSFSLPGEDSDVVVRYLNSKNIFVSNGAACRSHYKNKNPQILESFGLRSEAIYSVIRVSFDANNTFEEIDVFVQTLAGRKKETKRTSIIQQE